MTLLNFTFVKLFILLDVDGHWYAIDPPSTAHGKAAILAQGHRVFRTQENALLEGSNFWDSNSGPFGGAVDWQPLGAFSTTYL